MGEFEPLILHGRGRGGPRQNPTRREVLGSFADEGFVPPDAWNRDGIARAEAKRVRKVAYMGAVAAETPRRLGAGADGIDLAGDKFLSKRIANVYWTCWRRLCTAKNAPLPAEDLGDEEQTLYPPTEWVLLHARGAADDEARRAGRTVIWDRWWDDQRPRLLARRRALATFALRTEQLSWGFRIVSGISNEIMWVDDKFRDWRDRYVHVA